MAQVNNLDGKVAVITGGGGILCRAIALKLASKGMKIAVLDLKKEEAEKVASEVRGIGRQGVSVACNVLDKDSIIEAQQEVHKAFGSEIYLLVNGAGGNSPKATTSDETYQEDKEGTPEHISFFDLTKEGFSFVFDLNFLGTFLPCQVFLKDMLGVKGASVINISSMNAYTPLTKIPAYSAAKSSVSNFTQWLAVHFANTGLRVNAIAPGFFLTKQNEKLLMGDDGKPTKRCQKILSHTPLARLGNPEDLTSSIVFLADDSQSGFITGVCIPIDGGFSAYSGV